GGRAGGEFLEEAHADMDLPHDRHLRGEHRLERIGPVIVEAGLGIAVECAEPQHDAVFVGVDAINAPGKPGQDRRAKNQDDPLAAQIAAGQHGAQLVLAAPQKLFEIGRRRAARRLRPRAPWAFAAATRSPRAAALIAPRHSIFSSLAGAGRRARLAAVIGEASARYNASSEHAAWRRTILSRGQCRPPGAAPPAWRSGPIRSQTTMVKLGASPGLAA